MKFEISNEQVISFQEKGYLYLPSVLTPFQLASWRAFSAQLEAHNTCSDKPMLRGAAVFGDANKVLMRQNDLHGLNADLVLDLQSSPFFLAIARDVCGEGAIPLQMDLFYKHSGPQHEVKWHRDALYMKANRFINIGIYLDDSDANDGCLRYVPNSHKEYSSNDSSYWMEQTAKAGDVIVHDMRLLHGSAEKQSAGSRKTVYIEMSTVQDVLVEGHNSANWAELRTRWMGLILQNALSSQWHPSWQGAYPSDLISPKDEFDEIVVKREGPIPASYL